eukprot:g1375.t1
MLVLYASETGTARETAGVFARQCRRGGFASCRVGAIDDYPIAKFPGESLIAFFISTTGDGEPPSNMSRFWKFMLRKDIPKNSLRALTFVVFGFGDSSYAKYNAAARMLRMRLKQLGATELFPIGLEMVPIATRMHLAYFGPASTRPSSSSSTLDVPVRALQGIVRVNRRLTTQDWTQDVRHVEIKLNQTVRYRAGDVAVVWCENGFGEDLCKTVRSLGLDPYRRVQLPRPVDDAGRDIRDREFGDPEPHVRMPLILTSSSSPVTSPSSFTVLELFTRFVDIHGRPSRSFLEQLSFHAKDEDQRDKLLELASPDGSALYNDYVCRERRSYIEILHDFDSARPPLEALLSMIPPSRPRYFSISSVCADSIHLTVAVVHYTTPLKRRVRGVCSNWIASLRPGSPIVVGIKRGALRLDAAAYRRPIVCVGPGTGVAPMRAFLRERSEVLVRDKNDRVSTKPECHLFFGCRHKTKDFLYANEWSQRLKDGTLDALHTAFSRDQTEKIYVQTRMRETARVIWRMLFVEKGTLLVAGASKMASDVRDTILAMIVQKEGCSRETAGSKLRGMERERRYQAESWS